MLNTMGSHSTTYCRNENGELRSIVIIYHSFLTSKALDVVKSQTQFGSQDLSSDAFRA